MNLDRSFQEQVCKIYGCLATMFYVTWNKVEFVAGDAAGDAPRCAAMCTVEAAAGNPARDAAWEAAMAIARATTKSELGLNQHEQRAIVVARAATKYIVEHEEMICAVISTKTTRSENGEE